MDEIKVLYTIFVNRRGISKDSFMKTIKLKKYIQPNSILKFYNNELIISNDVLFKQYFKFKIPKYCIFNGFIKNDIRLFNKNNILGSNKILMLNNDKIIIPVEKTTKEYLNFYNCKLIDNKEIFILRGNHLMGLYEMEIGKDYLNDYLLQPLHGNGMYIEYHNQPHYYNFIESKYGKKGYLILGKKLYDDYILTAFEVPQDRAIYVAPNVYHCDGCLIGKYNVIYSKTNKYQTLLLHNNDEPVKISFTNI